MLPKCPNCGSDLDDNSYDFGLPDIDVSVSLQESDAGAYIQVRGDDSLDCELTISCMHCWWWMQLPTSAQVDIDDNIDGRINERLAYKPSIDSPLYDDATEMWSTPKQRKGY